MKLYDIVQVKQYNLIHEGNPKMQFFNTSDTLRERGWVIVQCNGMYCFPNKKTALEFANGY